VLDLLAPLPFRTLDAGRLANNRTIERMTLLGRELAVRAGHYPRLAWRLLGGEVPA
jgi:predicted dinucleotide-binding enzyme